MGRAGQGRPGLYRHLVSIVKIILQDQTLYIDLFILKIPIRLHHTFAKVILINKVYI